MARACAGVQAQDRYAARLSFRSRSRSLTAADVDRARTEERSLLRTWVMRMTIHLIPTEDAGWMLPLFEPRIEKWSRRRLGQLGMEPNAVERTLRLVAGWLAKEGPLTRTEIAERLRGAGIELDQQTRGHLMGLSTVTGIACLGPDRTGGTCLVRREDWLGTPPPFDRDAALGELARRYLRAFGPATDRDFAYWSGLGLGEVRSGLERIATELSEVSVEGETALMLGDGGGRAPRAGQLRMLGAFDTYLLGYANREFAVAPEHHEAIKRGGGGWIRPAIVLDGAAIGTWRSSRKSGRHELELEPFARLDRAASAAIEAEVADIGRFEGVEAIRR